jgi:D-tyrosyl-tRNA(Tyr) deacylase
MARKLHELRILDGERSCAETGARPLVDAVVVALRARGATVATGVFGAAMAVESVNDGPFTVLVETG